MHRLATSQAGHQALKVGLALMMMVTWGGGCGLEPNPEAVTTARTGDIHRTSRSPAHVFGISEVDCREGCWSNGCAKNNIPPVTSDPESDAEPKFYTYDCGIATGGAPTLIAPAITEVLLKDWSNDPSVKSTIHQLRVSLEAPTAEGGGGCVREQLKNTDSEVYLCWATGLTVIQGQFRRALHRLASNPQEIFPRASVVNDWGGTSTGNRSSTIADPSTPTTPPTSRAGRTPGYVFGISHLDCEKGCESEPCSLASARPVAPAYGQTPAGSQNYETELPAFLTYRCGTSLANAPTLIAPAITEVLLTSWPKLGLAQSIIDQLKTDLEERAGCQLKPAPTVASTPRRADESEHFASRAYLCWTDEDGLIQGLFQKAINQLRPDQLVIFPVISKWKEDGAARDGDLTTVDSRSANPGTTGTRDSGDSCTGGPGQCKDSLLCVTGKDSQSDIRLATSTRDRGTCRPSCDPGNGIGSSVRQLWDCRLEACVAVVGGRGQDHVCMPRPAAEPNGFNDQS